METSASSPGAWSQTAEFEPDCASVLGAHSNTGREEHRMIRDKFIG